MSLARALFAPRAVALVGASGEAGKNTARPQRFLQKHGFQGKVFPVNPSRKEIFGEKAFPSIAEIPNPIDQAFIMVDAVEEAIEDCGRKGVPVASIFSDGFADAGPEGLARQARLAARAKELGVRLLGPNSMGVIDIPGRVPLTVNAVLEMDAPPAGAASIVSQSGTMLGTVLSRGAARGIGFAKLVSVGNEADLKVGEIVDLLAEDGDTKVILLFLETLRDADRLALAARKAHGAGKPIVAYKLGRSALGEALARSHTGALAGSDAALDAYFRACGILRVDMLETLVEIVPLVQRRRPLDLRRKPRVAVVTTTGGGAASVVDRLGMAGLECGLPGAASPVIDLTLRATPAKYRETLEELLASPDCDAVLAVVGSSAQFQPELAIEPIVAAAGKGKPAAKPFAAFLTPHAERSLLLLAEHGVAGFRTPEGCADALRACLSWHPPRSRHGLQAPRFRDKPFQLIEELGIPVAEHAIARAPGYAHSIAYPVAVKLLDAEHKTEFGGVSLGVADRAQFEQIARRFGKRELLVQRMESGVAEAIVGYRDDPLVGPVVLVGAGGTLAEIYRDVALAMAPVGMEEAEEMLFDVKAFAAIRGYRNLPRGDVKALAAAVSAFSRIALMDGRPVAEAEINPLIVKTDGVVAVDGLIVPRSKT